MIKIDQRAHRNHSDTLTVHHEHSQIMNTTSDSDDAMEPRAGIEPATSSLPRMCSTPELPGPDQSPDWSGWRESNPHFQLGRLEFYH